MAVEKLSQCILSEPATLNANCYSSAAKPEETSCWSKVRSPEKTRQCDRAPSMGCVRHKKPTWSVLRADGHVAEAAEAC